MRHPSSINCYLQIDKSTTYTQTEVDCAFAGKTNQLATYTKSEVNTEISRNFTSGVDDATDRSISLHPSALRVVVTGCYQTIGAAIIMTMDQASGVNSTSALSVKQLNKTNRIHETLIMQATK